MPLEKAVPRDAFLSQGRREGGGVHRRRPDSAHVRGRRDGGGCELQGLGRTGRGVADRRPGRQARVLQVSLVLDLPLSGESTFLHLFVFSAGQMWQVKLKGRISFT